MRNDYHFKFKYWRIRADQTGALGKGRLGDKVNRQQGFHRGQAHMIRVNGIYNGEVVLGIGENNRNASGMR